MWVWSCQEDLLEEEMAIYFSILAWRTPWTEEPCGLQSTALQRVGSDWATQMVAILYGWGRGDSPSEIKAAHDKRKLIILTDRNVTANVQKSIYFPCTVRFLLVPITLSTVKWWKRRILQGWWAPSLKPERWVVVPKSSNGNNHVKGVGRIYWAKE